MNYIRIVYIIILIYPSISYAVDINYDIDDISNFIDNDDFVYQYQKTKCDILDPLARVNRKTHHLNRKIDRLFLKPHAQTYKKLLPSKIRKLVNSFFTNLQEPISCVNYILQKNLKHTVKSILRFSINSTIGLGGLVDVAGRMGIKSEIQQFSDTLAFYGAKPGAYIVLPVIGGIHARQIPDILALFFFNPIDAIVSNTTLSLSLKYTDLIALRCNVLNFTDYLDNKSLDHYIGMRDAIHNSIEKKMNYPNNFKCK